MPRNKKEKDPSFEQSLEELEAMVETMESGQLPLEKLISSYERGAELIAHCETVLNDARKRLELITLKPSNTNDEDNTSTKVSEPETSPDTQYNDDDEIRLF